MTDTFDAILKYVTYVGLGLGALSFVFIIFILVEKPYRRRTRRVAGGDGQTPSERKQPVEDFPDQTAK